MDMVQIIEVLALGLAVGLVSTFLGVGGGLIIVPVLPWLFGLTHHQAIATSLFTILLVSAVNTWMFHIQKRVIWRITAVTGPLVVTFSFISGWLSPSISATALKIFLLAVFGFVILQSLGIVRIKSYGDGPEAASKNRLVFTFLGILAGITSGFGGIGSGIIIAPFLLSAKLVKADEVTPTSNSIMMLTTLAGAVSFMWKSIAISETGNPFEFVQWNIGIWIFVCASVTGFVGRHYQQRMPATLRKQMLLTLLVLLMSRVAWDLIQNHM